MATTTPDGLWSPDATTPWDFVGITAQMQQSAQTALNNLRSVADLPEPIQVFNAANNTVVTSTTTGAAAPNAPTGTLTLARPCWVMVNAGCWAAISGEAEIRVGINISGATQIGPSSPTWGQVERYHPGATSGKATINRLVRLNSGVNTITFSAWKVENVGTASVSYMMLDMIPLRWAD